MPNVKITGIKEVQDMLKNLEKKAKELEKGKEVSLIELMSDDFIKKHTHHESFENFIAHSGLLTDGKVLTEDILNSSEFNQYVKTTTKFKSWKDMLDTASTEYIKKQLGF